ncbi:Acyl transferase domain containing protein [Rhypophila decipiens]
MTDTRDNDHSTPADTNVAAVRMAGDTPCLSNGPNSVSGETCRTPIPLAICGMAMRLPGNIKTGDEFWDFLVNKRDARAPIPPDRRDATCAPNAGDQEAAHWTTHGYMLDNSEISTFDGSLFSMTRSEVERTDPQQRLLLELARECFENAGETAWRGKQMAVYIGSFDDDWNEMQSKDTQEVHLYSVLGSSDCFLSNRISYEYNLTGPSLTVRTACSASLYALHLACQAVQKSSIIGPRWGSKLESQPIQRMYATGALSVDALSKAFDADADADGYARAEAVNMVFVKRLDDALRDGNPVRAILRATAVNSDGKTRGITRPSSAAHEASTTKLPNMGHSEGASGLTSLIKCVLALERKAIPPNIKFDKPNPNIPFDQGKLRVPTDVIPWPKDRRERVSINSFGVGGANAHAIIDSAASFGLPAAGGGDRLHSIYVSLPAIDTTLLVFTANHPNSLQQHIEDHREYIAEHPGTLDDVAYTLGMRREHLAHRAFALASSSGTENAGITVSAPCKVTSPVPEVVFVFTGQGAQWATMGANLIRNYPSAMDDLAAMDDSLSSLGPDLSPGWTLADELGRPEETSRVHKAELSQPLCAAIQIVIVNLLQRWGISPVAVIGHSSGEIAAAYACGAMTIHEAIICAYLRGKVTALGSTTKVGGMAAIGLGSEHVQIFLSAVGGVTVACENSPSSTTISGDKEKVLEVLKMVQAEHPNLFARMLKVDMACHSHHMEELGEQYEHLLGPHISKYDDPFIPFFSTVTGTNIDISNKLDARYWRTNLESPVRFKPSLKELISHRRSNKTVLVEIGPHSALSGPIRQIVQDLGATDHVSYLATLTRGSNDTKALLTTVGHLFCQGHHIRFDALNPRGGRVLTDLPTYPWNRDARYWHETRLSYESRMPKFPHHELLGSRIVGLSGLEPSWRNLFRLDTVPWCRDHKVGKDIVFPAAGYLAMASEAVRQLSGGTADAVSLRQVHLVSALILTSEATEIVLTMRAHQLTAALDSAWYDFTVSSCGSQGQTGDSNWIKHCFGQVRVAGSTSGKTTPEVQLHPREVSSEKWYKAMSTVGLNYGPHFQQLDDIKASPVRNAAVARLRSNSGLQQSVNTTSENLYCVHPTVIDSCLQLFTVALARGQPRKLQTKGVPTYIREAFFSNNDRGVHATDGATASATVRLSNNTDSVRDFEFVTSLDSSLDEQSVADSHGGSRLCWQRDIDLCSATDVGNLLHYTETASREAVLPPLQKLLMLCCLEAAELLQNLPTHATELPQHLIKFQSWIQDHADKTIAEGRYAHVSEEEYQHLTELSPSGRREAILDYAHALAATSYAPLSDLVCRIYSSACQIFSGEIEALEVLRRDDGLTKLYNWVGQWDYTGLKGSQFLLWLTRPCQVHCESTPQYATILGLLRVLRSELGTPLASLEMDEWTSSKARDVIWQVYSKLGRTTSAEPDDRSDPDYEFAYSKGCVYIPRVCAVSVDQELAKGDHTRDLQHTRLQVEVGRKGILNSIQWVERPRPRAKDLDPLAISIEVKAVGMNFKDSMIAMGMVKNHSDGFGIDCAGIVTAVGTNVHEFTVGDRVIGIADDAYATVTTTLSSYCVKIPDGLTFEEAASMPAVYATVMYSLLDLARLEKVQSVLIHSACGGVGIAALNICRAVGLQLDAEVFATVGNEEKVEFLMTHYSIPRRRIFCSRDAGFFGGVMRETGGKGVDVVLNSLSGELLHASWQCVAEFGSMIELGKRDFIDRGRLAMDRFEDNRSFFGVDLGPLRSKRPGKPIRPIRLLDAADMPNAIRTMQKGQHIGKLVVAIPKDPSELSATSVRNGFTLRDNASYLLAGGLGGLGRSIAVWMAEHGAKNLVFITRGGGNRPEHKSLIHELGHLGCTVQVVSGSVSSMQDISRAVSTARLPIVGVLHLAMVLQDSLFAEMPLDAWETAMRPKVQGAWNLHSVLLDQSSWPLDFFVLFSSSSGILGQQGQANYAAANTFLDAFVQFRQAQGLPASVIDLGVVGDVGYVSERKDLLDRLKDRHTFTIYEQQLLDAVELSIKQSRKQSGDEDTNGFVCPSQLLLGLRSQASLSDQNNRTFRKRDARVASQGSRSNLASVGLNSENSRSGDSNHQFGNFLAEIEANPGLLTTKEGVTRLARHIGSALCAFVMKPESELDLTTGIFFTRD